MPEYKATAYLRLSYALDRTNESDSISNQKKLIKDFVQSHHDIELYSESLDDGYSCIHIDSPAFQQMMEDITAGKIN